MMALQVDTPKIDLRKRGIQTSERDDNSILGTRAGAREASSLGGLHWILTTERRSHHTRVAKVYNFCIRRYEIGSNS